jgi:hypothetical protein
MLKSPRSSVAPAVTNWLVSDFLPSLATSLVVTGGEKWLEQGEKATKKHAIQSLNWYSLTFTKPIDIIPIQTASLSSCVVDKSVRLLPDCAEGKPENKRELTMWVPYGSNWFEYPQSTWALW